MTVQEERKSERSCIYVRAKRVRVRAHERPWIHSAKILDLAEINGPSAVERALLSLCRGGIGDGGGDEENLDKNSSRRAGGGDVLSLELAGETS